MPQVPTASKVRQNVQKCRGILGDFSKVDRSSALRGGVLRSFAEIMDAKVQSFNDKQLSPADAETVSELETLVRALKMASDVMFAFKNFVETGARASERPMPMRMQRFCTRSCARRPNCIFKRPARVYARSCACSGKFVHESLIYVA